MTFAQIRCFHHLLNLLFRCNLSLEGLFPRFAAQIWCFYVVPSTLARSLGWFGDSSWTFLRPVTSPIFFQARPTEVRSPTRGRTGCFMNRRGTLLKVKAFWDGKIQVTFKPSSVSIFLMYSRWFPIFFAPHIPQSLHHLTSRVALVSEFLALIHSSASFSLAKSPAQELEFHHMRTTLSEHPQLEFRKVLPGASWWQLSKKLGWFEHVHSWFMFMPAGRKSARTGGAGVGWGRVGRVKKKDVTMYDLRLEHTRLQGRVTRACVQTRH